MLATMLIMRGKKVAKTLDVLSASDYTKWQYELAQLTNKNDDYIKYFGNYQDLTCMTRSYQ